MANEKRQIFVFLILLWKTGVINIKIIVAFVVTVKLLLHFHVCMDEHGWTSP